MPYVPGFSYDLFISYAREDNVDEWVERFQAHLSGEVARLLGRPFSEKTVFLDKIRLEVGQSYPEILDTAARESAVLVALISPSYATSNWCSRERDAFRDRLAPGVSYAESLAACRIRPTPPLPQTLAQAQQADFVVPGFQEPWPTGSGKWIEAVNRLAVQVSHMLQKLRNQAGSVFVGKPLNSHMQLRDDLVDYLAKQHFRAAPEPIALLEDRDACRASLGQAVCAVHFVGQASPQSLTCIEDSVTCCAGPTVLFQPFGLELSAEEDLLLLQLPEDQYPHQLGPNEIELKKFLEELLTRRAECVVVPAALGLICDAADIPWAQQFAADELSVEYPRFLQDKLSNQEQIQNWRKLVRGCHGLLFYHGRSGQRFLSTLAKLADQEKSSAIRRWYLAEPDLETKQKSGLSNLIYPEGLEEFLNLVRERSQRANPSMAEPQSTGN